MKILVVDDVGFMRRRLEQLLTDNNHVVVLAESGHEALNILQHDCTIEAVLTDLNMPGMTGIELYLQAKKIEWIFDDGNVGNIAIPFILITASQGRDVAKYEGQNLEEYAKGLGFIEVLPKQMGNNNLLNILAATQGDPRDVCSLDSPVGNLAGSLDQIEAAISDLMGVANVEALESLQRELEEKLVRVSGAIKMFADQVTEPVA
jgi:CheY-like chemotaxis protein